MTTSSAYWRTFPSTLKESVWCLSQFSEKVKIWSPIGWLIKKRSENKPWLFVSLKSPHHMDNPLLNDSKIAGQGPWLGYLTNGSFFNQILENNRRFYQQDLERLKFLQISHRPSPWISCKHSLTRTGRTFHLDLRMRKLSLEHSNHTPPIKISIPTWKSVNKFFWVPGTGCNGFDLDSNIYIFSFRNATINISILAIRDLLTIWPVLSILSLGQESPESGTVRGSLALNISFPNHSICI